ncbi:hypothetical protein CDD80_1488 [Ophiocordyceps camponoti-rufipedis]|uniref:AMP-dependent synthetase/ligase domain-containing protein n=1 Tax=Ophiocordyceps camponoti-rufipedis TaxID=2004952 RepID=A0A2C5Z674_9HYPO|nr:hypothetical protein CDD80_1488 [Ophiocordyceps camponoti-rufipedis]
MPISSPWRDMEIPDVDLWTFLMERPKPYPDDHTLFVDADSPRSYTFAQVKHLAQRFGLGLRQQLGWSAGDMLAVYAPNDIDTPVVNLGVLWAGGVVTPANPTYTAEDLARQLRDSGARALVTHPAVLDKALEAAAEVGLPADRVFLLGAQQGSGEGRCRHWNEIGPTGKWFTPQRAEVDAKKNLAFLVYSSGTTGMPKGVMLSHYNVVANAVQSYKGDTLFLHWDLDRHLGVLPFFHIYGLSVVINTTIVSGATCHVMPRFDIVETCRLIQKLKITFLYVPPPIVLLLTRHPAVSDYDLSSLRFITSGAAPLSKDLVAAVWQRFSVGVKQGYGLSETAPVTNCQLVDEWWRFQGSVGRLLPNITAKIVDPDGNEVPPNEAGELLFKGPNVFSGYWKRPALNSETFTADGWYRTGDVGYACPQGYFYITDRIKELIKYNGFQVPPAELESKLLGNNDIADVGVIGVWDAEKQTEVPRAYIVPKSGVKPSDDLARSIMTWLEQKVAGHKRLRGGVRFIDEIPKAQSGKILRRVLKDMAKKEEEGLRAKL